MRDALSNYLSLANGITEVTRQRAMAAARALVSSGEATAEQIGTLAEDLVETSRGNREVVTSLVRFETDRALGRLGLATNEEVSALTRRIQVLEASVRELAAAAAKVPVTAERSAAASPPKTPAPAKRPAAKAAPAKAAPAKAAPAKAVPAKAVPAKAASAKAGSAKPRSAKAAAGRASATRTTGATRTTPAGAGGTAGPTGTGSARAPRRTTGPAARS